MSTGTLSQDLHAEVGVSHLLLVVFFTLLAVVLQIQPAAQFFVSLFKLFALVFQTALDDFSTGK